MLWNGGLLTAVGLAAIAISAGLRADDSAEKRLEAAIHREVVLGDIDGAAAQYRGLLSAGSVPRPVAARALFQLGQCLEKSGHRDEARRAYARVAAEYAEQGAVAELARAKQASWDTQQPGPRNLTFERGVPGKVPPGWFVPALPRDADYVAELRRSGCRSGIGCAVVVAPANAPSPFGSLMQSFSASSFRGKRIRLRAWLKVEASGDEDRGQMWLSVDRMSRQSGFLDNMSDRSVRDGEWTRREIESNIDDDATFINFGIMAFGRARVWVDDVAFEVVGLRQ